MAHSSSRVRRWLLSLFVLLVSCLLAASVSPDSLRAADDWQFANRRLRLPVTISANGSDRADKIADVAVNFTQLLASKGVTAAFDPGSLRVVEVNAQGDVLDTEVPFQFDPAADYHAAIKAQGNVVIMLSGTTAANASRRFHVYFDAVGPAYNTPAVAPRLKVTDPVQDAGYAAIRLETPTATYIYHKTGGGFARLFDLAGSDWISWNKAKGSAGDYRGIPNMVLPGDGGYFHPGRTGSDSTVINEGPLKVSIRSTSNNRAWETLWEIYPDYARMTVTKAAKRYWFLYEGTPGGELTNADRVVRANGNETAGLGTFAQDLGGEEWVYFRDPAAGQSLFLVHEQEDALIDSYKPGNNQMTIFGFGRNNSSALLSPVPQHFVIGLAPAGDHAAMTAAIHAAYKPLAITIAAVESDLPDVPGCGGPAELYYFSSKAPGTIDGIAFGDEDVLVYDRSLCEWSLYFDGSAAGLPGPADVDGLEIGPDGALYLSFVQTIVVPGIAGKVDDSDIVRYDGAAFTLWFDGSLFGLKTDAEDVDAVAFDADGRLIISTLGNYSVPGAGAGGDEDLLRFDNPAWTLVFDGSHSAGLTKEDIDGAAWLPDGRLGLNLVDSFAVGGLSGNGDDVLGCLPLSLGPQATACEYSLLWGSANGLTGINAFGFAAIEP